LLFNVYEYIFIAYKMTIPNVFLTHGYEFHYSNCIAH